MYTVIICKSAQSGLGCEDFEDQDAFSKYLFNDTLKFEIN